MLSEKFKKALMEELGENTCLASFFNEIKEEIGEKPVDIVKTYPESWEEFCSLQPILPGETCIDIKSKLDTFQYEQGENFDGRDPDYDRNLLPNKKTAEAILALCQLLQLRDWYRQGWVPSYGDRLFLVKCNDQKLVTNFGTMLSFPSEKVRDLFMHNFSDLLGKAKPLFI